MTNSAEIASVLGLARPKSFDELKLVDVINSGVPATSAGKVVAALDPSGVHNLKASDFVPKATLHRGNAAQKPLSKDASETLWQVARVFVEARRIYGDGREATAFLARPHALLDGRRPLDLARESAAGADLVLQVLQRADVGVAV